jgi:hypothetical protein
MYIRWITRRHKSSLSAQTVFHDAYLVESYRDERDRPRQRTLCYLGNLRQIEGEVPLIESELFLTRATQALHCCAVTTPIDVQAILEDLRRSLPALTPDAARGVFMKQLSWFHQWWRDHGDSDADHEVQRIVEDLVGGLREQTR